MREFYVGLHQPSDARHFDRMCISINRLLARKRLPLRLGVKMIIDSGAFTEIAKHGRYRNSPAMYAEQLRRVLPMLRCEVIVVTQDMMCEPFILAKTGLTVADHQRITVERYDALLAEDLGVPIMPVLQGYEPREYAEHIQMYGNRLPHGAWVGVGSVCKRNAKPDVIAAVLSAISAVRPDLRLHGFGIKKTSLLDPRVRDLLHSADSMAWSASARWKGGNANDWRNADTFRSEIEGIWQ